MASPSMVCRYIAEPKLRFGNLGEHEDPKTGISRFGPKSYEPRDRHPDNVRIGLIGSANSVDCAQKWIEKCALGIKGDSEHLDFPGIARDRGFFTELVFDRSWIEQLTKSEIDDILETKPARTRFEALLDLLENKLRLLAQRDREPEYVVVALPDNILKKCKVVNYKDRHLGNVHRDLRRAFKIRAMKYRMPTQFLLEETTKVDDSIEKGFKRGKDYPSEIAWDFFTALYFKAGGFPWGPIGLPPSTCYVGIGFYRPIGSHLSTMQTSLVQAFNESGDGLVLRGPDFNWDPATEGTRSPHLTEDAASELTAMALARYESEMKQTPMRVVVHKTSRYWPEEKVGFETVLKGSTQRYDLVALAPQSMARLLPVNSYPPLRGTIFSVDDIDYLYTTGYLSGLQQFHSVHVPSPLRLADHIGYDTSRNILLGEILTLTKMNWNASRVGGLWPITLRFSRVVGGILREVPSDWDQEPLANFKYYM